jgi:hypothetical protein
MNTTGNTNPRLIASTLISRLPRFCDIVVRLVAAGDGTLPRLPVRKHVWVVVGKGVWRLMQKLAASSVCAMAHADGGRRHC